MTSNASTVRANLLRFALYLILASVGLAILSRLLANDANYVLFRFAAHLASGHGLNYQIPDSAVATYPVAPALLALFANISLPVGTWLLSTIAIAVGAVFIDRLVGNSWIAGGSYVIASLIFPSPILLIMLALTLAGLDAARYQRWVVCGTLIGLATVTDSWAIVPAALIVLLALRAERPLWHYLCPAVITPALALALVRLSLGATEVSFASVTPQIITAVLPILAILSLVWARTTLREKPTLAILVVWSACAGGLALLHGTWPTAVILPGAIALVTLLPVRFVAMLAAALDLALNMFLPNPSAITPTGQELGLWIAAHTSTAATLATSDIGSLGFNADRPIIDLSGQLQSNTFDQDFFLRSAPDLIVLKDITQVPWDGFKTTYARVYSVDGQSVYQRAVNFTPLETHAININFSANLHRDDLELTNIAVATVAHPGDLVRIRLDWQLNNPSSFDKNIKIMLNDTQGKTAVTALDKVSAAAWTVGTNTTYHLLVLPAKLQMGVYSVYVEVTVNNGDLGPFKAADMNVTK